MDKHTISEKFYSLVAPSHPNEWEVEEVAENLALLPDRCVLGLLNHTPAIWPISHSLCYGYLQHGAEQIEGIGIQNLPEWVRRILFHYEQGGLRTAVAHMADAQANFIEKKESVSEVMFTEVGTSMTHYIRGVSGQHLKVAEDQSVWTDTDTIYLPPSLDIFTGKDLNRLLYKFLVTYQWVLVQLGVFTLFLEPGKEDARIVSTDAAEWRHLSESAGNTDVPFRLYLFAVGSNYIKEQFPGLWNRSVPVFLKYLKEQGGSVTKKTGDITIQQELVNILTTAGSDQWKKRSGPVGMDIRDCQNYFAGRAKIREGDDVSLQQYLLGELHLESAERVIMERREAEKKAFITMLARMLPASSARQNSLGEEKPVENQVGKKEAEGSVAVISESIREMLASRERKTMQLQNEEVAVPDELRQLAEKITSEFGSVPVGYVQAAAGLAGQGITADDNAVKKNDLENGVAGAGFVYDEWDCRRNGYRRDWCTVLEEELELRKSNFIPRTLHKHRGLRKRLRAQFELMQTTQRFVRRQRDGDDLDLDAITDAIGDHRAGKSASDRLFVRLLRDERSISTLFLIDMSNSTSGWIGTFIKESLVLLCEAMEKVGDQYGIYGFSGMRRSRCKLYHIKNLDEPYDAAAKDRISAIGPKDYTRMAPAIRHMMTLLENADARTRLLITLSDGKPEDYDGYYGEYAIEDTKKALLEARGKGISPFCITIDKKAQDYLGHMFGAGNYCFINRIENLPVKMAQIYRMLTRR